MRGHDTQAAQFLLAPLARRCELHKRARRDRTTNFNDTPPPPQKRGRRHCDERKHVHRARSREKKCRDGLERRAPLPPPRCGQQTRASKPPPSLLVCPPLVVVVAVVAVAVAVVVSAATTAAARQKQHFSFLAAWPPFLFAAVANKNDEPPLAAKFGSRRTFAHLSDARALCRSLIRDSQTRSRSHRLHAYVRAGDDDDESRAHSRTHTSDDDDDDDDDGGGGGGSGSGSNSGGDDRATS